MSRPKGRRLLSRSSRDHVTDIVYAIVISSVQKGRGFAMPSVVIRNLPVETHRALKLRAVEHGRSTEAEIREIIERAVRPAQRVRLGSELAALGRKYGGVDLCIERDKAPAKTVDFE